jgi:hypothetical protein
MLPKKVLKFGATKLKLTMVNDRNYQDARPVPTSGPLRTRTFAAGKITRITMSSYVDDSIAPACCSLTIQYYDSE